MARGAVGASAPGWGSTPPEDGRLHTAIQDDLDALDVTFATADLTTFCRLDELGLTVVGWRLATAGRYSTAGSPKRRPRRTGGASTAAAKADRMTP